MVNTAANQEREMRVAVERVVGFAQEFGEAHLNLACHAAFPLSLTPDLLYQIWANFVPEAPWSAVARVLLSRLCKQVGAEMYEMDNSVRNLLLRELKVQFGQERFDSLGEFLLEYVSQRLTDDDPDTQDLRQAQEWTALAYTKPKQAAKELAQLLSDKVQQEDVGEVLRLSSLVKTLSEPLIEAGFKPLLVYGQRMRSFFCGNLAQSKSQLGKDFLQEDRSIVAGIKLYIPVTFVKNIQKILDRIKKGEQNNQDINILCQWLQAGDSQISQQLSKFNINILPGKNIHIGDRTYYSWDDNAIQALVKAIREAGWQCVASLKENDYTQVENQATRIGLIDKLAKQLTDFSQQSVMRYGLKLAFSPNCTENGINDQEYFVSSGNQVIKRWQINSWEMIQEISVSFSLTDTFDLWFTSIAISPDSQYIAAGKAYQIYVWRLGEEKPLYTFGKTLLSNFLDVFGFDSVTFSSDGKILAANDNQNIKLWDIETGKEVTTLSGHSDKVTCVAFNPSNGKILASCSYDKTLKLWDIETKKCLGTLEDHRDSIYTLAFSPDGEILASGSNDNTIRLWYPNTGEMPKTLRHHSDGVTCLVFHPNGKSLFSGSNDNTIIEWTVEGEILSVFPQQHLRGVTSIAISPDGETLISGGRDQMIKIWL